MAASEVHGWTGKLLRLDDSLRWGTDYFGGRRLAARIAVVRQGLETRYGTRGNPRRGRRRRDGEHKHFACTQH